MKAFLTITLMDFKLIFRDASLKTFLFLPLLIFLLTYFFIPYLLTRFPDIEPYLPYVLILITVELTQAFDFIYAMILIDEKETGVASVYGVVPVGKLRFLMVRLTFPTVATFLMIWILLLTQPFYEFALLPSFLFSIVASLIVPVFSIGVSVLSNNRMEGMVWAKVFNLLVVLPMVAFFVPDIFSHLFIILPTHWAFQALNDLILLQAFAVDLLVSFFFLLILTTFLARRFVVVHYQ